MFYYRFRSAGELALKELLYDELYLASSAECNDPHDGMAFLAFGRERDKWQRLIGFAWRGVNLPSMGKLVSDLLEQILTDCPLTYADAIEYNYKDAINGSSASPERPIADVLAQRIRSLLTLYKPQAPYFASFSLSQDNPLMWSHYASMHQGHCLIFRDIDGYLEQCPRRRKKSIHRQTNGGLAPRMGLGIAEKLPFQAITYREDTELRDAFERFPEGIYGKGLSKSEGQELMAAHRHEVLTKNAAWSYESEVRVTVSSGAS